MISAMMQINNMQFMGLANDFVTVDTAFSACTSKTKQYWLGYYYFIDL